MKKSMTQMISSRAVLAAVPLALALGLTGCFGNDDEEVVPTPTPTPVTIDVSKCLNQTIPGTGVTVAQAAVPDVLNINPNVAAGFPNGRKPADPVIDVILAVLLLDVNAAGQSPATFAALPLNPASNDVAFPAGFPYLAPPQGSPPVVAGIMGSNFDFRTDAESAYVRVDRTAFPALATALIPSGDPKLDYNDANPAIDASGQFVNQIAGQLTTIATALQDDLTNAGFNTCAD